METSSEDELEKIQKKMSYKLSNDSWSKRLEELSKKVNAAPSIPKEYRMDELRTMNFTEPFRNCLLYTSPSPRDQRG